MKKSIWTAALALILLAAAPLKAQQKEKSETD